MSVAMSVALTGAPFPSASHWLLLLLVLPPVGVSFVHDNTAKASAMNAANNANFFILVRF
jgi:hypothetical protein